MRRSVPGCRRFAERHLRATNGRRGDESGTFARATSSSGASYVRCRSSTVVRDGDEVVAGEENLLRYLDELRDLLGEWDRFGSDACYIEEDGSIC